MLFGKLRFRDSIFEMVFTIKTWNLFFFLIKKLLNLFYIFSQSPPSRSSVSPLTSPTSPTRPLSMATIAAAANSGLNLNMSAAQLRARLAAQKKYDPKREAMDLRRKHEIIQTMWIINPLHTHTQQSTIRKVEECNQWRGKRWREIISIWIIRQLPRVNNWYY